MFPKLRFKEFDGDLTESKLVELTSWASGGTPAKDVPEYWGDGIPLISGASMHTNQLYESDVKITKLGLQKGSKLALKDSILILVRGSMLFNKIPMGITLGDVAFNQDVKCIRPKQQLAPLFLFQWLHAKENTIQNKVTATGIGAGKLDTADLQNLKLYKPSLEEQTKIATFLSAVDEKISQLTQKHQLLREYKQGMMQKLFSQQVRFKADDGSEFGEWENKTLSKFIIKHIGGASLKPSDFVEQSEYEVIPKKAIVPNGYLNLDKDNPTYCSEDFFKANLKNTVDNTYLVTVLRDLVPSGPSIGYIVKYMENTQYILAQGVYGFKLKEELNKDFLIHYSNTKAYRLVMQSIMVGSTQVHIRNQDFFGIEIPVPCLEEQTKIANFLSAIDQKIEVVAQQIEQAKTWKKGLLQQMFV